MTEFNWTQGQKKFLEAVSSGKNIFLTGKAGTGKSAVVKEAIKRLQEAGRKIVAVAPTGIAANNIDGVTIHSLFSIPPFGVMDFEACSFMKEFKRALLRQVETIVLDEVSMLRPDLLDAIHWTLRKNGLKGLDQRQIILVGDMKQLPPILEDNTRSVLYETYDGDTFEFSKIYQSIKPETIELEEVVRQTNEEFIFHLNKIREGGKSDYFRQFVCNMPKGVILAPHNSTVKAYNEAGLNAQPGEMYSFQANIDGTAKPEDFNLEQEIRVKDGCKIMYLVNSPDGDRNPLRNGTLGIFRTDGKKYFIEVNKTKFALDKVLLSKKQYVYNPDRDKLELLEIGSIEQYPFKLAYALSIHKAQGLTFDEVTIDLTRPCFQKGQMYVALSRVRTPEGLKILTA